MKSLGTTSISLLKDKFSSALNPKSIRFWPFQPIFVLAVFKGRKTSKLTIQVIYGFDVCHSAVPCLPQKMPSSHTGWVSVVIYCQNCLLASLFAFPLLGARQLEKGLINFVNAELCLMPSPLPSRGPFTSYVKRCCPHCWTSRCSTVHAYSRLQRHEPLQ